jgi:hypothetical protein
MSRARAQCTAVAAALLVLSGCGSASTTSDGAAPAGGSDAASPGPVATPTPSAAPPVSTPAPTPTVGGDDPVEDRQATAADAAAWLATVDLAGVDGLRGTAVDLDGDAGPELVLRGVRDGRGWVGVATWDGGTYAVVTQDVGAPARRTDDLRVADVNGDGAPEVVLMTAGDGSASLSLWSLPTTDRLVRVRSSGGCNGGGHVFGVIGAELVAGPRAGVLDVVATCDDSPLPVADWGSARFRWDGDAYRAVGVGGVGSLPEVPGPDAGVTSDDGAQSGD